MSAFSQFPEIRPDHAELLEAAGYPDPRALARAAEGDAHRAVELAAWQKGKLHKAPTLEMLRLWIRHARQLPGSLDDVPEATSEPAPATEPSADDLPEAIALERPALPGGGLYVAPSMRAQQETAHIAGPAGRRKDFTPGRGDEVPDRQVESGKFTSFKDYQQGATRVAPLNSLPASAGPREMPTVPKKERIDAKDQLSRWVRRGVVHPRPGLLIFGAIVSLLWRIALVCAIVGLPWLIFTAENPGDHKNLVSLSAAVLAVLGFCQLIALVRARCRICSCHMFYSRNCIKNSRSHRLLGLGHVASLAIHLLTFQWFRCMYCGTAIRLFPGEHDKNRG